MVVVDDEGKRESVGGVKSRLVESSGLRACEARSSVSGRSRERIQSFLFHTLISIILNT